MVASFDTRRDVPATRVAEPTSGLRHAFDSDLRPGYRISSGIELIRPLATGGMGQVWLAEHKGLDIQVAVKFMRRDVADDPVSLARFEQEAKLAARIKSPHVVEVLDYDVTSSGTPYIVMESLTGRDLETALSNGRTLGIADTARVLVQVCKALSKAHAVGVIHRDIKAENVFVVQEDGTPMIKVLDFGVARDTLPKTGISLSGTTVGTPVYMSPEQLFHPKEIDLRTDLWATAVLVYRCLTGNFPFEGESFPSVCLSVSKGKFAPPSAVNSGLPAEIDAWFKKAFHKSIDSRFSSATEMADAFLNELRRADLLPAWAQPESLEVALSTRAPSGSPLSRDTRGFRRVRAVGRTRVFQVGAALATMFAVVGAPLPPRAAVMGLADRATAQAQAWAVGEGLVTAPVQLNDDGPEPAVEGRPIEVVWTPAASGPARAERELARGEGNRAIERRSSAPSVAGESFIKVFVTARPEPSQASGASSPTPAAAVSELATIQFGL